MGWQHSVHCRGLAYRRHAKLRLEALWSGTRSRPPVHSTGEPSLVHALTASTRRRRWSISSGVARVGTPSVFELRLLSHWIVTALFPG